MLTFVLQATKKFVTAGLGDDYWSGVNIFYFDCDNDLVVVRWIKDEAALNEFVEQVIEALRATK
jgi:hypothetical protein